jgi:site-specific recombinase XerD
VAQTITSRFRDLAGELELPRIGVYGLRHSSAPRLIGEGVNLKVVAQRLGHASVSVTLGLYSHVMTGQDRAAAETFARAIAAPSANRGQSVITEP